MSLRDHLIEVLKDGGMGVPSDVGDDTALISGGLLDSLGLFNLAVWIEQQIGAPVDVATVDPAREWDTIAGILAFIERRRAEAGRVRR